MGEDNLELNLLRAEEEKAFISKQLAYKRYADARDRTNEAYDIMQSAWEDRCSAQKKMEIEYEVLKHNNDDYQSIWSEFEKFRDETQTRIEKLREKVDSEQQDMKRCFSCASNEYEFGDKAEAARYSREGHKHRNLRDLLNDEISSLRQDIDNARENAKCRALEADDSLYRLSKIAFKKAKARHKEAHDIFLDLKVEREQRHDIFLNVQKEHELLKEELRKKLSEVRQYYHQY